MKIFNKATLVLATVSMFLSCKSDDDNAEDPIDTADLTFQKIGSFSNGTGDEGFAEISAFDPITNKLFIVNPNDTEISVWDISNPAMPVAGTDITVSGIPNSVSVYNGIVAIALENAADKQANGTIATYNSDTQTLLNTYNAGPLPDMVTFSPDGKYIVAANEGERFWANNKCQFHFF